MAQLGRSNLNGGLQSRFPDNVIKFITALRARLQLTDISDSKFNLIDDDATDINFDNTGTDLTTNNVGDAIIEISSRVRPFLGGGTLQFGDIGGEQIGEVIPILDGTFTSCTMVQDVGVDVGSLYEVVMPDVGTADYQCVFTLIYNGRYTDKVFVGEASPKTATGFRFFLGEEPILGTLQDVDVQIMLIKKF